MIRPHQPQGFSHEHSHAFLHYQHRDPAAMARGLPLCVSAGESFCMGHRAGPWHPPGPGSLGGGRTGRSYPYMFLRSE
ncbi:hypothetical protein MPQ_2258 [Methylovorus sp. MP688]|nr:hypothetical protein MPQ_2258 [Methylovorus sp. MP688]